LSCTSKHQLFALIEKRHTPRSLLVTGSTTTYLGLLVGRGFIEVHDHGEFFSSQSPQPRKASGLGVVLSAGHLNAASSAPQERHRTQDRGQRRTLLPSGRSSSFGYGTTKPAANLFHLEHYAHRPSKTIDPDRQLLVIEFPTN
jgi:hypothetical protein